LSAWERALQGIGGGGNAVVAARNRDAQRRMAQARVVASPNRPGARPSGVTFPTAGFVPTAGFGPGFQPSNEDYASGGRMAAQIGQEILFGPERASVITSGQASLPERFVRDWFTAEQERNLATQAGREGRVGAALGWGGLAAAGLIPFGKIFRGIRTAGNVAETAADASRVMPLGPPPTPPVRSWDPWSSEPMPEGWNPLSSPRTEPSPISPPTGPTDSQIRTLRLAAERELLEKQKAEAERLNALRALEDALNVNTLPALPIRSSLSRTNPLGDLRITSGTPEVTTGTRTTLRDFALPYERLVSPSARELAESTAAPFLDAGLLTRADLNPRQIERAANLFARTDNGRTIRDVPRFEVDRAQRVAQEVAEDYRGGLFQSPSRLSVRGANPDLSLPSGAVPFRHMAADWTHLTYPGINELVYGDYVDEIARALGRAPYRREVVDVEALTQLLEAINSGQVSSVLHPRGLQGLLDEGVVPNIFDVRATSAGVSPSSNEIAQRMNLRRISETSMLGVPYDAPGSARPRYGYIEAPEGYSLPGSSEDFMRYSGVSDYGPIVADWSNDIRNRASYTVGDSLNQIVSGVDYRALPRPLAGTTIQDLVLSGAPYARSNRLPYVEAQLFDGPTIENLTGLRVAPQYFDETSRLLQSRGVDVPVSVLPEPTSGFPWERRRNSILPFRPFP